MHTLRDRLRTETRLTLEAADRAFRALDPREHASVSILVTSHADVFRAMRANIVDDPVTEVLDESLALLDLDIGALAPDHEALRVTPPDGDQAVAQRYVWQATRMVTRMFARRWQDGPAATEGPGGLYLASSLEMVPGRAFLDGLEARDSLDSDAPGIVRAANAWFARLEDAAKAHGRAYRKSG